jgi:hypothetical protein
MKAKLISLSLAFAAHLIMASLSYAQSCVSCTRIGQCGSLNPGGCACVMTSNNFCGRCGQCVDGNCIAPCNNPNVSQSSASSKPAKSVMPLPPTVEQLSKHPWVSDDTLPATIAKHSPALGRVLSEDQQILRASWCTNFHRGNMMLTPGDESTAYGWELIVRDGADEYRARRFDDGGDEQGIIITATKWVIYRGGDLDNVVVRGDLGKAAPEKR